MAGKKIKDAGIVLGGKSIGDDALIVETGIYVEEIAHSFSAVVVGNPDSEVNTSHGEQGLDRNSSEDSDDLHCD